jgi:hypothetical protein
VQGRWGREGGRVCGYLMLMLHPQTSNVPALPQTSWPQNMKATTVGRTCEQVGMECASTCG